MEAGAYKMLSIVPSHSHGTDEDGEKTDENDRETLAVLFSLFGGGALCLILDRATANAFEMRRKDLEIEELCKIIACNLKPSSIQNLKSEFMEKHHSYMKDLPKPIYHGEGRAYGGVYLYPERRLSLAYKGLAKCVDLYEESLKKLEEEQSIQIVSKSPYSHDLYSDAKPEEKLNMIQHRSVKQKVA